MLLQAHPVLVWVPSCSKPDCKYLRHLSCYFPPKQSFDRRSRPLYDTFEAMQCIDPSSWSRSTYHCSDRRCLRCLLYHHLGFALPIQSSFHWLVPCCDTICHSDPMGASCSSMCR